MKASAKKTGRAGRVPCQSQACWWTRVVRATLGTARMLTPRQGLIERRMAGPTSKRLPILVLPLAVLVSIDELFDVDPMLDFVCETLTRRDKRHLGAGLEEVIESARGNDATADEEDLAIEDPPGCERGSGWRRQQV